MSRNANAERNGPFLFWCIEKMWGAAYKTYRVCTEEEVKQTPNNIGGLYLFYLDGDKTRYPVYVGVTGRNFRQRFKEHCENGVIEKWVKGFLQNQPPIHLPLHVAVIPIQYLMQAKLMESVFLNAFNFCLNAEENGQVRHQLDTGSIFSLEESKADFDIAFKNVMKEIQGVYDTYMQEI